MPKVLLVVGALALLAAFVWPMFAEIQGHVRAAICMKNQIQLGLAWSMYAADYDGHLVPLASGAPAPAGALLPGTDTWWPDLLMPYLPYAGIYACPSRQRWGIGMNRPEVGRWRRGGPALVTIVHPEETIVFADAALVTNPGEPNPDRWVEHSTQGHVYFRTPNDLPEFVTDPHRVVDRHDGRMNVVCADGHVRRFRAGELGLQYPKGHPRAKWDVELKPRLK